MPDLNSLLGFTPQNAAVIPGLSDQWVSHEEFKKLIQDHLDNEKWYLDQQEKTYAEGAEAIIDVLVANNPKSRWKLVKTMGESNYDWFQRVCGQAELRGLTQAGMSALDQVKVSAGEIEAEYRARSMRLGRTMERVMNRVVLMPSDTIVQRGHYVADRGMLQYAYFDARLAAVRLERRGFICEIKPCTNMEWFSRVGLSWDSYRDRKQNSVGEADDIHGYDLYTDAPEEAAATLPSWPLDSGTVHDLADEAAEVARKRWLEKHSTEERAPDFRVNYFVRAPQAMLAENAGTPDNPEYAENVSPEERDRRRRTSPGYEQFRQHEDVCTEMVRSWRAAQGGR